MANRAKNINKYIGSNIRAERVRIGLTQSELAKKLDKSDSGVIMWELGISEPDNDTVVALAKIFNVTTDYLLGIEDKPLNIPPEVEGARVAFSGGLEGLTQDDIDDVAKYIAFLKDKRK